MQKHVTAAETPVLPDIHDATFDEFRLSRRDEWGPGVYVHDANLTALPDGTLHLRLGLQSGDELSLIARVVEVIRSPASESNRHGVLLDRRERTRLPIGFDQPTQAEDWSVG